MSSIELFKTKYTTAEKITEISNTLNEPNWLNERRNKAYNEFETLPYDKDTLFYKYTNFRKFNPESLSSVFDIAEFEDIDIEKLKLADLSPSVIENESGIVSELSETLKSKGVYFGGLHELIVSNESLAKDIILKVDSVSSKFDKLGSLAKAFANNILVLYVPKNVQIDDVLLKTTKLSNKEVAVFSEFIIFLEDGSEAKILENLTSDEGKEKMYVSSQTFILGANARLSISQLQNWDDKTIHVSARISQLGRFANLNSLTHLQGGELTRHNSNVLLNGDGSEGYDLFVKFGSNKQRFDVKSELHHNGKDTIGNVHARTVMMDKAESILRGLIVIPVSGVNTDSWLTSQGMTIGKGKIVAIPALNIDQNDVKAAHAASVEPLNEDLIFYLTSRGIKGKIAKEMLVKGYFEYILKKTNSPVFQEVSREYLANKWDISRV